MKAGILTGQAGWKNDSTRGRRTRGSNHLAGYKQQSPRLQTFFLSFVPSQEELGWDRRATWQAGTHVRVT